MTMSFLPSNPESNIGSENFQSSPAWPSAVSSASLHIPREKLQIPVTDGSIVRKRVVDVLKHSSTHFPATFVCGRSGTGKTAAVASFVSERRRTAWNTLEPPDVHWACFANSTSSAVRGGTRRNLRKIATAQLVDQPETKDISRFVDSLFAAERSRRELIVFDNVHYVFDTHWFREFFELLLPAIPESSHVIFIARSKPPFPLWRMRSKQFINLIEEKIFAFDEAETVELFRMKGLPEKLAGVAHRNCFGKVSHMLRFAESAGSE